MKLLCTTFTTFILLLHAGTANSDSTKAEQAVEAVKNLCLTGGQYDLKVDVSGNLKLLALTPGGKVSVSVNARESSGAAAIFDEKLRLLADQDIRYCIKPYIERIITAILDDSSSDKKDFRPNLLLDIIKTQQIATVRKSHGEFIGQNFSERDLRSFIRQNKVRIIANNLIRNIDYIELVLAIKNMNPTDRNDLYTRGYQTYRPTWAEMGRIDPNGQTVAGQEADKMIARAIIEKTQELLLLPNEEISRLYK